MKRLPQLHADDILLEVEEWLQVMSSTTPDEFMNLRARLNDAYHDIVNDPDLQPILTYSRVTQDAYTAMNLVLPNVQEAREYIASGATFIPVMLELIAIGYSIAKREEQKMHSVKNDTNVTH